MGEDLQGRHVENGCEGRTIQMDRLDHLVADYLEHRLLDPNCVQDMLAAHLDRREERDGRRQTQANELTRRAAEAEQRLKHFHDAIESGVTDLDDPSLKKRIEELKATRDQARVNAPRARAAIEAAGQSLAPTQLKRFVSAVRIYAPEWRRDRDSNPGDGFPPTRVPGVRLRPLGHLSGTARCSRLAAPKASPASPFR